MPLGRDRRQRRRRAAALGGAAIAAKKHHDAKTADQEEAAAAPPEAPTSQPADAGGLSPEVMDDSSRLGQLHEKGVLTDEEFEREKAKLLGLDETAEVEPTMIWAILALLGVPLWLCAPGILSLVLRNRELRKRYGDIPVRVRRAGKKRWTRGHAIWVSDVFACAARPRHGTRTCSR